MSSIGDRHMKTAKELHSRIDHARRRIRRTETTLHFVFGDIVREWSIFAYRLSNFIVVETALLFIITLFPIVFYISVAWGFIFISGQFFFIVFGGAIAIMIGYAFAITVMDIAYRPPQPARREHDVQQRDNGVGATDDHIGSPLWGFGSEDEWHGRGDTRTGLASPDGKGESDSEVSTTVGSRTLSGVRLVLSRIVTALRRAVIRRIYFVRRNYWYYIILLPSAYIFYALIRLHPDPMPALQSPPMQFMHKTVNWIGGVAQDISGIIPLILGVSSDTFWRFLDQYWMAFFAIVGILSTLSLFVQVYRKYSPYSDYDEPRVLIKITHVVTVLIVVTLIALVVDITIQQLPPVQFEFGQSRQSISPTTRTDLGGQSEFGLYPGSPDGILLGPGP